MTTRTVLTRSGTLTGVGVPDAEGPDAQICALVEAGRSIREIARELAMKQHAVRKALDRLGVQTTARPGPKGDGRTERVALSFTPAELAEVEAAAGDQPVATWAREAVLEVTRRGGAC